METKPVPARMDEAKVVEPALWDPETVDPGMMDATRVEAGLSSATRSATSALMFDPLRFSKPVVIPPDERKKLIAEAAYYRAQNRGFLPGYEIEDWLAAEAEVAAKLYGKDAGR